MLNEKPSVQGTYENLKQSAVYLMFKNSAEIMRLSGYLGLIEELLLGLNGTLLLTTNQLFFDKIYPSIEETYAAVGAEI